MRAIKIFSFILILVVLLSGCQRYNKVEVEEIKLNHQGKTKLVIDNTNGDIYVNKTDTVQGLVVKAEKIVKVKKRDLDKPLTLMRIEVDTLIPGTIVLRTQLNRDKGFFKIQFGDNKVNYNVYLPEGLNMEIDNTNGSIELTDCDNNFIVETVNGNITAKNTTGKNKFELTNGKFLGSFDSTQGLSVETVNGSITLELPENFHGGFDAEWVNGKFNNEGFTFNVRETDKRNFKGYIGSPVPEIRLITTNGRINIIRK